MLCKGRTLRGRHTYARENKRGREKKEEEKIRGLRLMQRRQRLSGRDLDNWEQQRVKRLPGENDGIL